MKYFIVMFAVFASMNSLWASPPKNSINKQKFIDAEYFFLNEDYEKAVILYADQYKIDSTNCNLAYRIGLCYLHIPLKLLQAIPFLEAATQNVNAEYKEGSYKETAACIDVYYYLGYAYQMSHEFDKAIENYDYYQQHAELSDLEFVDLAVRNNAACQRAKLLYSQQREVEINNLGRIINSQFADFNPCVSQNDSLLIYTVKTKKDLGRGEISGYQYKIFSSRRRPNDKWTHPSDISSQLQSNGTAQIVSLSADGTMMFLYRDDYYYGSVNDVSGGNIYYSYFRDGKWLPMKRFDEINSIFDETHASISDNGKAIYFTSNRKGGFGGLDLYRIDKMPNGKWTAPQNLGANINSPNDEIAPFIVNDSIMYFCSDGHDNIGGFDVFYSKKNINEQWSAPVNMGTPINSPADESFFMPTLNGSMAYISMVRPDGYLTFGSNDIFSLSIVNQHENSSYPDAKKRLCITLSPNNSNELLDSIDVQLISTKHNELIIPQIDYKNNTLSCLVHSGTYILSIESKSYHAVSQTMYVPSDVRILPSINIALQFNKDEYIKIVNLHFDKNSKVNAQQDIERVLLQLRANPALYVELIEPLIGDVNLSHARKQAIVEYLHQKGVEPMRFVSRNVMNMGFINQDMIQLRVIYNGNSAMQLSEASLLETTNKNHLRYSILLSKNKMQCDTSQFLKYYLLGMPRIFTRKYQSDYICYCGDFASKATALSILNKAIDVGFADAQLIDFFKLNQLSDIMVVKSNPKARFTVQVGAFSIPTCDDFKTIGTVNEVYCSDGYYRYICGEFETLDAANLFCKKVIGKGYSEVFVVSIEQFAKCFLHKTAEK